MANQQQKANTKTTTQKGDTQIPQPDMRFAIQQRSKANSKGQGPTKTTTNKDLPWIQWYKATVSQFKKMHQKNWLLPSKVKHAFLIVAADRQRKNALAVHNCVLASQSPLTGSCSGVQSKTKRTCRVPNGVFMSRENVLLAARLLLCRPPCGEQLRGCGKDGHIRQGR